MLVNLLQQLLAFPTPTWLRLAYKWTRASRDRTKQGQIPRGGMGAVGGPSGVERCRGRCWVFSSLNADGGKDEPAGRDTSSTSSRSGGDGREGERCRAGHGSPRAPFPGGAEPPAPVRARLTSGRPFPRGSEPPGPAGSAGWAGHCPSLARPQRGAAAPRAFPGVSGARAALERREQRGLCEESRALPPHTAQAPSGPVPWAGTHRRSRRAGPRGSEQGMGLVLHPAFRAYGPSGGPHPRPKLVFSLQER